ncbi:MAG: sugar transporter ATP-binding protein [Subtercola sp.]|nr:sugar transporter ATP-binding protein [Subtercola sp.]
MVMSTASMRAEAGDVVLELRGVSKSFGPVQALRDGELVLRAGSIHALMGENGAGKSTIVKIIAGLYQRDSGEFVLGGETVHFRSTADSKQSGIAVIYQEPTLFPDLSVTENIFMGRHLLKSFGRIDRAAMRGHVRRLFQRLGVDIDPDRPAEGLSIADQQIIEIAKAISLEARILIMDEPTAALSEVEASRLFAVARSLRDEGRAILFISHRFDEVYDLCDTITVMRDGAYISTDRIEATTVAGIVRKMVGRDVDSLYPKQTVPIGDVVLKVEKLTSTGQFHDISFEVRAGEIVGLAGLVGAGRSEVARAIFGIDSYESGTVTLEGRVVPRLNTVAAMQLGIALVPEDRRQQGIVLPFGLARNSTLAIKSSLARFGFITNRSENRSAADWLARLSVKANALDTSTATLSGGNQQKVVLAKWLATNPTLLIVDEPTRGIDVGTKADVHALLSKLAGEGLAIIMISSELPEVLGMADRILVMREGHMTADIPRSEATAETVMFSATHERRSAV